MVLFPLAAVVCSEDSVNNRPPAARTASWVPSFGSSLPGSVPLEALELQVDVLVLLEACFSLRGVIAWLSVVLFFFPEECSPVLL